MRRKNLLTQVLAANLLLIVVAVVVDGRRRATRARTSPGDPELALVLALAVALTILVNVIMLQRRFRPARAAGGRDGARRPVPPGREPARPRRMAAVSPRRSPRLQRAFRRMLERLDAERRRTSSAALAAQEEERARVARDLHDEVNQSLTALLLRLEAARVKAPVELAHELAETKALANQAMEELLMLARQLRPTALDDLGLEGGAGRPRQGARPPGQGQRRASTPAATSPGCPPDVQLVVYRVAQEALSNAAQHSGAEHVRVRTWRARATASSSRSATTARASPSTRPPRPRASRACASGRCSWAATCRSSRGRSRARGCGSRCRWSRPIQSRRVEAQRAYDGARSAMKV